MNDTTSTRMIDREQSPTLHQIESWMGKRAFVFWMEISDWIARNYPGVFAPDWIFGGKKHGWCLRYKRSKSFCSLVPERNRLAIMIVFGAEERAKVETIRAELSPATQEAYDRATTYHDGKWLLLPVTGKTAMRDAQRLLAAKRRFKNPVPGEFYLPVSKGNRALMSRLLVPISRTYCPLSITQPDPFPS